MVRRSERSSESAKATLTAALATSQSSPVRCKSMSARWSPKSRVNTVKSVESVWKSGLSFDSSPMASSCAIKSCVRANSDSILVVSSPASGFAPALRCETHRA